MAIGLVVVVVVVVVLHEKSYPIADLDIPSGLQEVEVPRISRQLEHESDKVISPMRWPSLPPGDVRESAGRMKSMKKLNDLIENRNRDLPTCGTVFQPTAPPRVLYIATNYRQQNPS
jgi:hypothetical protein